MIKVKNGGVSLLRNQGVSLLRSWGVSFKRSSGVYLSGISIKDADIKLSKEEAKGAYSVYLALVNKDIVEVEVVNASKGSTTYDPGKQGTNYTMVEDAKLNNNPGLNKFHTDVTDAGGANQKIVNDLFDQPTTPQGDKYQPDSRDGNSVFFGAGPDQEKIKGTIIINGTNSNKNDNAKVLKNALQKQNPVQE